MYHPGAAPWAGRHLGVSEVDRLLWSSPARVIAVVGPHNAGKTTLLASFFLQLANGQCRALDYRFASSLSFYALHELAEHVAAWDRGGADQDAANQPPRIVPHTPKEEGPVRFLHLGLRPEDRGDPRHVNVLFSDCAGEWFTDFTQLADDAARARMAFVERCHGFLVVADACALLGSGGAGQDAAMARMIRRVVQSARATPALALVFSKLDQLVRTSDFLPPEPGTRRDRDAWGALGQRFPRIWRALAEAEQAGVLVRVFPASAFPCPPSQGQPIGVEAPFAFLLGHADQRAPWPRRMKPVAEDSSAFAAMRRWPDDGHDVGESQGAP